MASHHHHTTQRLQNEFLSCPRCAKPFKDPKALPCMHNLCKACLQLHIDEEMGGSRRSSFTCPVCKTKIFAPDPGKPTGIWANQFPSNFVIKGMIDAIAVGSPELASPPGVPRGRHPLSKSASVDRDGRPGAPASSSSSSSSSSKNRGRVSGMGHSVDSAGSVDLESNPEVSEVWRKVHELRSSVQAEESGIVASLTSLNQQRDDQERAMTDAVSKLQDIINMRKAELLDNLSSCFSDEVEKLRQRVQSCKDNLQSLKSCEDLLRSVATLPASSDSASDLLESVTLQLEEVQYRPRPENPARVVLEYDATSVYKVTEALASFGSVHVEKEGSAPRPAPAQQPSTRPQAGASGGPSNTSHDSNDGLPSYGAVAKVPGSSQPQLVEKITPGQLVTDGQGTQIYDIAVTSTGIVVMTVYGEKLVQAFTAPKVQGSKSTRRFLGRIELDTEPRCLCMLTQSYAALVGDMCIYLVAVLWDRLELKKTIPTGKMYTGISAYGEDTLVVSCQNPVCVDFVSLSGFITETIDKDRASSQMLFKAPSFLASTPKDGLLFVSDVQKLLCVNNAGKVKYEFPKADGDPLQNAQGVCCDPAGFVYLVDRGKRCVLALSARGTRIADVLTSKHGLTDPAAVALDQQGLLYVTNDFMEILVFKVY
ncbi:tripartite motif-containing protein 3-like [Littorina saxatilis]|uniref:RING-type domain-containing protein n=1 Tax=Littorina saxatilis TaxID=31220 RepID=A0AAN9BF23_9CAEN